MPRDYFEQAASALRRIDTWFHDVDATDQASELRRRIRERNELEQTDNDEGRERYERITGRTFDEAEDPERFDGMS
jgi:hypothetical protein